MKLSSLLSPKQVILDLKGESCAHALAHMVDHLVSRGILDSSLRDEVLSLLEEREGKSAQVSDRVWLSRTLFQIPLIMSLPHSAVLAKELILRRSIMRR